MPSVVREFAGTLNVPLTLESPSETGGGSNAVTWTTVGTIWAEQLGLGGAEISGIEATADYRFRARWRSDITPRWRIGLVGTLNAAGTDTRKLQIISVLDPDARRREILIVARETV